MTKTSIQIDVMNVLPKLERKLVALLKELSQEQWEIKALPNWSVKDVAAHLLDGALRRLSMARDGFSGEQFNGSSYQELVQFLDGLNADWVRAFRRVSPPVLIEMVERSSREMVKYLQGLDPEGRAAFSVAWAGENESANWFDVAREYTERWHHQQQIREAVGKPGIMGTQYYRPVLDAFMRALPVAYGGVEAGSGTEVVIRVSGRAGGRWVVAKKESWELADESAGNPSAQVTIPEGIAWKVFTKALGPGEILEKVKIIGEQRLAEPITRAKAIMG